MSHEIKRCKAYPGLVCESECFLIGHFLSQSEKGGNDNPQLIQQDKNNHKTGTYWSRENWAHLTNNTLEMAKSGCACRQELESIIAATTKSKIKKGEIVEKNTGRNFPKREETPTRNDTEPL